MKTALISVFAASVIAAPAFAEDGNWKVVESKGTTSLIAERGDVAFRCVDGMLRFIVATDGNVEKRLKGTPRHGRVESVTFEMPSGEEKVQPVYHFASRKMVVSGYNQTGRALFNAAIRGETVSINGIDETPISINWPDVDASAFNDFKAACGL